MTRSHAVVRAGLYGFACLTLTSPVAHAHSPTYQGVVYARVGDHPLRLDIHLPERGGPPHAAVFWIHGGGWRNGDRTGIGPSVDLLDAGIAVISIDYRLTSNDWPDVELTWPAQIHDVKGAVRFIRAEAATYGIDPDRLGAWGTSAGGHLTAMLALTAGDPELEGDVGGHLNQSSHVIAAADYYGPTDLIRLELDVTDPPGSALDHDAPDAPESQLIGWDGPGQGIGDLRANASNPAAPYPQLIALIESASPVNHVSPDDPPLFIAHGEADVAVPLAQSSRLADLCTQAGIETSYQVVPGIGHEDLGPETRAATRDFFVRHLLGPCASDLDADGQVGFDDVNRVLEHWDTAAPSGDANRDGEVDFQDVNAVLLAWGEVCE